MNWGRRRDTYWISIFKLLGHVVGSGLVFVFLVTVEWLISWFLSSLDLVHPMDGETSLFAHRFGNGLLYGDVALAGLVFVTTFFRFLRDLWEN